MNAISRPAIGLQGMAGAVTTPVESAAIRAYRAKYAERKETLGKIKLPDMIEQVEAALLAHEAGARAMFAVQGFIGSAATDAAIRLEAAINVLEFCREKAVQKAIEAVIAARAADKERKAYWGAKKREGGA